MAYRLYAGLALLAALVTSASADIRWGVNGHPFTAYPGISIEEQIGYVADLGMTSYRVNIPDLGRAPELAALVEEGKARGVDILPVITPALDLGTMDEQALYEDAYKLAAGLAARFKDDIRVWELGNELENYAIIQPCENRDDGTQYPCEWGPAGGVGALDYFGPRWRKVSAVLKGLSEGISSVDPTLRKAIGTAGWGHTGAFERIKEDGIDWDISVWHTYGEDPEWALEILERYDRPVWITEFNNPFGSMHSEQEQADGLKRMMARLGELKDRYRIEAAHVYELMDEPYWAPDYEAFMGLVRVVARPGGDWMSGGPKPAYVAVKEMIKGPRPPLVVERDCDLDDIGGEHSLAVRKVSYSYCLVLGRAPDGHGLEGWTAALRERNARIFDILLAMVRSDEFSDRYATLGLTNAAYVSLLYKLLLVRDPDPYGLVSYTSELNAGNMTRGSVALGILTSSEFEARHPLLFASEERVGAAPVAVASCPVDEADTAFPVTAATGKRHLEDAAGRPFFMHGDTAWSLIAQLTYEDAELYLRDRKARGFNTILVNLLEHRFATHAPANIHGEPPFLFSGGYEAPNEAYFAHADRVLHLACEMGFLVLLAPSYLGNGGGPEGWYQAMRASGPDNLGIYGRFLGERYGELDNIVWVHGGDYNPPEKSLVRAIAEGIREADPDSVHTAHGSPGSAAFEYWAGEPWLTVNNIYTYEPVHDAARAQYRRGGGMPFFLMESAYENEHSADAHRLRKQAYQAILSGAAGHLYGNNPIWHFDGPGLYPVDMSWQEALGSPGAESMTVLGEFIRSRAWWLLEPDLDNALLVEGWGAADSRAIAARARDGSFALIYMPSVREVTLDLAQIAGPLVAAMWFDPSSGEYLDAGDTPLPLGVELLAPPDRSRAGEADWILVLTSTDGPRS